RHEHVARRTASPSRCLAEPSRHGERRGRVLHVEGHRGGSDEDGHELLLVLAVVLVGLVDDEVAVELVVVDVVVVVVGAGPVCTERTCAMSLPATSSPFSSPAIVHGCEANRSHVHGSAGHRVSRRQPATGPPPAATTATSQSGTWRAPHSPRSCRMASARNPKPWSRPPESWPPHVFVGSAPPSRRRPPSTNGPLSPRAQNPSASSHARVSQLKPS